MTKKKELVEDIESSNLQDISVEKSVGSQKAGKTKVKKSTIGKAKPIKSEKNASSNEKVERGADDSPKVTRIKRSTAVKKDDSTKKVATKKDGTEKSTLEKPKRTNKKRSSHNLTIKINESSIFGGDVKELESLVGQVPSVLPVLPLRNSVVYNSMIVPLYEGREKAILAVDEALSTHRFLFFCSQKDETVENPTFDDLYMTGSVGMILRMVKLPEGQMKLLVQGVSRARILKHEGTAPYLSAKVELLEDIPYELGIHEEALMRTAREQSEKIMSLRGIPISDIMSILIQINDPGKLADIISANMRLQLDETQALLECLDPVKRLEIINKHLLREAEVADMQAHIQKMAREGMDKAQKDYYLREQLKVIRRELGDGSDDGDIEALKESLEKAKLPESVKKEADKQLRRFRTMHSDSAEASVIHTYLEWLSELPWKKLSADTLDIVQAKTILDKDHYGLERIKDRILEYLSVRKLNPNSKGPILCFVGPPGVGKTSLGRSIAHATGRKFQRISLGGMHDEAEIRGHRRTYIGAMPGRIIQAIKQAGTRNPVIILDEIDKLGHDFRGDPASALLEALDPEQNSHFSDHYLNVEFDLSKVLFICTANSLDTVPAALRDRFEVIQVSGYTEQEKLEIAKQYIVKKQVKENGLKDTDISIRDNALVKVIREYTREAGLRGLEREIGSLCRKLARLKAEGASIPFRVNAAQVTKLLGVPRYLEDERDTELVPGVAIGLAWTPSGGEVLYIEVSTMPGKGKLILTGQLGDVMKESAQAALSYARAHAEELQIDPNFLENKDIHIHVPAGATPKDGPSAGVTIMTALVSALSQKQVCGNTCMTGEITLRGRVLPVGGIKEKILGAVARGLEVVIIPKQNLKDLEEVPADLRRKLKIYPVEKISEVLALAFCS